MCVTRMSELSRFVCIVGRVALHVGSNAEKVNSKELEIILRIHESITLVLKEQVRG